MSRGRISYHYLLFIQYIVFFLDINRYGLYENRIPLFRSTTFEGEPMAENRKILDRRKFLIKGAAFLFGGLFGVSSLSKAFAFEENENKSFIKSHIALIIDDIGYSRNRARRFLDLGVPMTYAILPRLKNTHDLAIEIHDEGHEILLHQPMEPYNPDLDPGPGALYVGDRAEKIIKVMEENISSLPFIAGVNNHMGSRFTSSQEKMNQALRIIKKGGFFFVDSLTSNHSMAYRTARRLHMVTAYRNIFLDNRPDEKYILSQLRKLKRHALKYGNAIAIGHPHPETARAIGHFLKDLNKSDISMVYVSRLLHA